MNSPAPACDPRDGSGDGATIGVPSAAHHRSLRPGASVMPRISKVVPLENRAADGGGAGSETTSDGNVVGGCAARVAAAASITTRRGLDALMIDFTLTAAPPSSKTATTAIATDLAFALAMATNVPFAIEPAL